MNYITDILRSSVYIWVFFEAISNIYIYLKGYKNRKTKEKAWESPIVLALITVMGSIAFMSIYLLICSLIRMHKPEFYMDLTYWVFLFYFPIGLSLDKFREQSLCNPEELKKKLK